MRAVAVLALVLCVVTSACRDSTGPGTRHLVSIGGISAPAHSTPGDTLWVSFRDGATPCDTGIVVTQERTVGGARFAVSAVTTAVRCASVPVPYKVPVIVGISPPHAIPFVLAFAEPNRADSVLTVGP